VGLSSPPPCINLRGGFLLVKADERDHPIILNSFPKIFFGEKTTPEGRLKGKKRNKKGGKNLFKAPGGEKVRNNPTVGQGEGRS